MATKQFSYAQITAKAEAEIRRLMEHARNKPESKWYADWAFGVYQCWYAITCGWQKEGDNDRMKALTGMQATPPCT